MTKTAKIRWGILGPGSIAKAFLGGIQNSRTGELAAIGTRNPGKAGLAESFPGARVHGSYDALLADPGRRRDLYRDTAHRPRRMGDQGQQKPASTCWSKSRWG